MPFALLGLGVLALTGGVVAGPQAAAGGAVVLVACCVLALRDAVSPVFTWTSLIGLLVALVWVMPIRTYKLEIPLPFSLEPYRLLTFVLLFGLVVAVIAGRRHFSTGDHGRPLALLAGVGVLAFILNAGSVNIPALKLRLGGLPLDDPTGIKALTFMLSYLALFVLITSVIDSVEQVEKIFAVLVVGAAVIAACAIYEGESGYNVFDHLSWVPGLEQLPRDIEEVRGARLRVYASAQHPIALGCALMLCLPLAAYLMSRARGRVSTLFWAGAGLLISLGALATVSRTTVVMGIIIAAVALAMRGRRVLRYWPAMIVFAVVGHLAAPGAIGGLWQTFFPQEGLVSELSGRAGAGGSGRFADIGPGLEIWKESPIYGHGIGGAQGFLVDDPRQVSLGQRPQIIVFDNQYMNTLVQLGVVGIVAVLWWVLGAAVKLWRGARAATGRTSDLLVASTAAAGSFGAALFFFDAFYFVQATLIFVIVAALGLRVVQLEGREIATVPDPAVAPATRGPSTVTPAGP